MDLQHYREQIDRIDDELLQLFKERMDTARQIALYKKEHNLPVLDAAREKAKLEAIACPCAQKLYETIFALSRAAQERITE